MPIIFKIFFLLFLQQGLRAGKNSSTNGVGVSWESVLLSTNTSLTIQSDPMTIEQVLSVCSSNDLSCGIRREGQVNTGETFFEKATADFRNLSYLKKDRIMDQLRGLQGRAILQWVDQ